MLYLYFPQWQGSGKTNEIYLGASLLKQELSTDTNFIEINLPEIEELETEHNVIGYQRILNNLGLAKEILENSSPDRVFTLGGDCGVEVEPVTYLNKLYNSDLLVIWFDAHGDLNTPESSPSKTFHGMSLRMILGDGDAVLMQNCFSILKPNQIVLVGTRDLDQPENEYIRKNNITLITPDNLKLETLTSVIKEKGIKNVYIHLDLDVIDPQDFPDVKCPTVNGVSIGQLKELITYVKTNFNLMGGSLLEYTPKGNTINSKVSDLARLIFS